MVFTETYNQTTKAYLQGKRYIISEGGTRSGKTFSNLQLLYQISKLSQKAKVIHVVSHSTPHLKDGAIADFENILLSANEPIDQIRTQNPHVYKIGVSQIKFIGFDKLGKALGAARDILFINEANKMDWKIVHQLIQRTSECVIVDFNPSHEFWVDAEGMRNYRDASVIHSTFHNNYQNLSEGILNELLRAKQKHDVEVEKGIQGYWYNYWRVYGLGLQGSIEGVIFNDWERADQWPEHVTYIYGLDWGSSVPFALIKVGIDEKEKKVYVEEKCYKPNLSTSEIIAICKERANDSIIIADSADRRGIMDLIQAKINARPAYKPNVVSRIRALQSYTLVFINSPNVEKEREKYLWIDGKSDIPIDDFNHAFDAIGYAFVYLRRKLF